MLSSQRLWPMSCNNRVDFIIWIPNWLSGQVSGVVPQMDHWFRRAIFVAKNAHAGGIQHEKPPQSRFKAQPADSQHSEKMSTGKDQNVSTSGAYALENSICPCT